MRDGAVGRTRSAMAPELRTQWFGLCLQTCVIVLLLCSGVNCGYSSYDSSFYGPSFETYDPWSYGPRVETNGPWSYGPSVETHDPPPFDVVLDYGRPVCTGNKLNTYERCPMRACDTGGRPIKSCCVWSSLFEVSGQNCYCDPDVYCEPDTSKHQRPGKGKKQPSKSHKKPSGVQPETPEAKKDVWYCMYKLQLDFYNSCSLQTCENPANVDHCCRGRTSVFSATDICLCRPTMACDKSGTGGAGKTDKDQGDSSSNEDHKYSSSDEDHKDSSSDEDHKGSSSDEDRKDSSSDEDHKDSSSDEDHKDSSSDEDHKDSSSDEDHKDSYSDEDHKGSSSDEDHKGSSSDEDHKDSSSDEDHKDSSIDKDQKDSSIDEGEDDCSEETADDESDDQADEDSVDKDAGPKSLCADRQNRLLNGERVDDQCEFSGITNLTLRADGKSNIVCNAVFTIASLPDTSTPKRTFLTAKGCTDFIKAAPDLDIEMQIGEQTYPVQAPIFTTIDGTNGQAFIDINPRYNNLFNDLGPCQTVACAYNPERMSEHVDKTNCKVVSWGASDSTTLRADGLYELALAEHPTGCTGLDDLFGVTEKLCFKTSGGKTAYCSNDAGAPVYCKAPKTKEWILMGIVAFQKACDATDELGVIPFLL